eukprot:CAMPEP_0184699366 /NCGR_PEP_ID=MMETSP0313-20130426/5661_1 /TAXON_ID=2792 /ORGANISM="Porphyridium aerugineum, Strain SAG 1380-2" /LENGTH=675 /DNA_ID=CAMNT_0027158441 /DNA_START=314 /DNA_END=2338 /DNA_ORIENTATION=+
MATLEETMSAITLDSEQEMLQQIAEKELDVLDTYVTQVRNDVWADHQGQAPSFDEMFSEQNVEIQRKEMMPLNQTKSANTPKEPKDGSAEVPTVATTSEGGVDPLAGKKKSFLGKTIVSIKGGITNSKTAMTRSFSGKKKDDPNAAIGWENASLMTDSMSSSAIDSDEEDTESLASSTSEKSSLLSHRDALMRKVTVVTSKITWQSPPEKSKPLAEAEAFVPDEAEDDDSLLARATSEYPKGYDPDVAKLMVEYTSAAYCRAHNASTYECGCGTEAMYMVYVGRYQHPKFDSKGFVGINHQAKYIVAAFRGTVSLKNWASNLKAAVIDANKQPGLYEQFPSDVKIHMGFYRHYESIGPEMVKEVVNLFQQYPDYLVYVTGHSLGGAMAAHATLQLALAGIPSNKLVGYTFGQPRVGMTGFQREFDSRVTQFYRVVNDRDVVVHLPSRKLGFRHVGEELWFSSNLSAAQRRKLNALNKASNNESPEAILQNNTIELSGLMDMCSHTLPTFKLNVVDHLLYSDRVTGKRRLRGEKPPKNPVKPDGRIQLVSESFMNESLDPYANVLIFLYRDPAFSAPAGIKVRAINKQPLKDLQAYINSITDTNSPLVFFKLVQMNASKNDCPYPYLPDPDTDMTIYFKPAGPHMTYAYHPIKYEGSYEFEELKSFVELHCKEPDW